MLKKAASSVPCLRLGSFAEPIPCVKEDAVFPSQGSGHAFLAIPLAADSRLLL
jgi:hypothetical protein